MGWSGSHAKLSRSEVEPFMPPASCKRCWYFFRVWLTEPMEGMPELLQCDRCGIHRDGPFRYARKCLMLQRALRRLCGLSLIVTTKKFS